MSRKSRSDLHKFKQSVFCSMTDKGISGGERCVSTLAFSIENIKIKIHEEFSKTVQMHVTTHMTYYDKKIQFHA